MKIGDIVKYTGASDGQKNYGRYTGNWNSIYVGFDYKVSDIEVHSWHTAITLENIEGTFNSVCFEIL